MESALGESDGGSHQVGACRPGFILGIFRNYPCTAFCLPYRGHLALQAGVSSGVARRSIEEQVDPVSSEVESHAACLSGLESGT